MLEQSRLYFPLISSLLAPPGAASECFGAIAWCSGLEQGAGGAGQGLALPCLVEVRHHQGHYKTCWFTFSPVTARKKGTETDEGGDESPVQVYQNQESVSTTLGLLGTGNEPSQRRMHSPELQLTVLLELSHRRSQCV